MRIHIIDVEWFSKVSGSGANSATENVGAAWNKGRSGGAPNSCANAVGIGMILGTAGALFGAGGLIAGTVLGGLNAANGNCNNSPYGNDSSGGGKGSGANYGAQCTW